MALSFFQRLFSSGKTSEQSKQNPVLPNPVYMEENIRYSITYRNYKSPMHRYHYKKLSGKALIGYSDILFVAYKFKGYLINVPLHNQKFAYLNFSIEDGVLLIKYHANDFIEQRSGEIELRFHVKNIEQFKIFIK